MKKQMVLLAFLFCVGIWSFGQEAVVAETQLVPTAAVLNFEARSRQASNDNVGKSMGELLFVKLLESGCVDLVERAELDKALELFYEAKVISYARTPARIQIKYELKGEEHKIKYDTERGGIL